MKINGFSLGFFEFLISGQLCEFQTLLPVNMVYISLYI
jgi:hypothetical protein